MLEWSTVLLLALLLGESTKSRVKRVRRVDLNALSSRLEVLQVGLLVLLWEEVKVVHLLWLLLLLVGAEHHLLCSERGSSGVDVGHTTLKLRWQVEGVVLSVGGVALLMQLRIQGVDKLHVLRGLGEPVKLGDQQVW